MLTIRKKLAAVALAAVVAGSAVSMPVWSESQESGTAGADAAASSDDAASSGENEVFVTEAEAMEGMEIFAEKGGLKLYVDKKNCVFMIEDTNHNYKWWSNYYNTSSKNKTKLSKRSTVLSIDVIGTESKTIETSMRTYDTNVKKTAEKIDGGVKFKFYYNKYDIEVPLEIVLNSDGTFTATVPSSEIVENNPETSPTGETGYQILNVHVLENLGAAYTDDEGYMVVPDGSGAVINYNNGTTTGDNNTYEARIYGKDLAVGQLYAGAVTEKITLPVMATINKGQNAGLVMIPTHGEEYGVAHAMVTGQNVTDLNACWYEYILRTTDRYFMGNNNEPLYVYEARGIKTGNVSTTYYPIYGEDIDYNTVAKVYRDYLTGTVGVTKKTDENSKYNAPFYLTLFGGTTKTRSILGFPIKVQTTATTYAQALEIIKTLESKDVRNIKIIYEDFNEAGIIGEISSTFQYSSKLGGKGDWQKLMDYVNSKSYEMFPSCDIMEFYKSGNGYSFTLNASKQITKAYATQTPFDLAFGLPHESKDAWTILSPFYFNDIFTKLIDSFRAERSTGISLNQASNLLYSDFSRENAQNRPYFVREDTIGILQNGYQRLKDSGFKVMTENANQYILPYADHIKDVPLYSSNYDIFDYDIPLTEMVIHGLVPYTTKAINKSASAEELRLLALVTGTPIHYEMMYENPNTFSDSEYDSLYYTNYLGWTDRATNEYKLFNEIINAVSDAELTKYEHISMTEYQSTFSNGDVIYVNTATNEIKYNGKDYKLSDYGLEVSR